MFFLVILGVLGAIIIVWGCAELVKRPSKGIFIALVVVIIHGVALLCSTLMPYTNGGDNNYFSNYYDRFWDNIVISLIISSTIGLIIYRGAKLRHHNNSPPQIKRIGTMFLGIGGTFLAVILSYQFIFSTLSLGHPSSVKAYDMDDFSSWLVIFLMGIISTAFCVFIMKKWPSKILIGIGLVVMVNLILLSGLKMFVNIIGFNIIPNSISSLYKSIAIYISNTDISFFIVNLAIYIMLYVSTDFWRHEKSSPVISFVINLGLICLSSALVLSGIEIFR